MLTVPSSLTGHQRLRSRRRPAVTLTVRQERHGVPILEFENFNTDAQADAPIAAAIAPGDDLIVCARNNAGSLDVRGDITGNFTNLDTVSSGQGLALAYDPVAALFVLVYGDGTALKVRTSADGVTYGASTTIVTEASAIGAVALAINDSGDACAFYVLGTSTTLKRLRRTAGTWAAAGTNWTRSGSVASLSGLAAVWRSDFHLIVTGTAVTTTHERVWAVSMGDGNLPANAWSGLVIIQEADAAAGIRFEHPHCTFVGTPLFATFQQIETDNVTYSRTMTTHTGASGTVLTEWREPYPSFSNNEDVTAFGAALVYEPGNEFLGANPVVTMLSPAAGWTAELRPASSFGSRLQSLSWQLTPTSLKVRFELEDASGDGLTAAPGAAELALGYDVALEHGYNSGDAGEAEFGATLSCNISRISRRFDPPSGKRLITVEAGGPWETLARHHAPQAWTAPATTTRGRIFQRVAGRAGLGVADSASLPPSTAWTTDTPTFAIAAGESAKQTLTRLLAPTADFLSIDGAGDFVTNGFAWGESPPGGNLADYGWKADGADPNPLLTVTFLEDHQTNWFRVQGSDRYADHFPLDDDDEQADNHTEPPRFQLLRDVDVNTDAEALAVAKAMSDRYRFSRIVAEATVPANVAHELYDVVRLDIDPVPGTTRSYRVMQLGLEYRRGPASGAPAYLTTFGL